MGIAESLLRLAQRVGNVTKPVETQSESMNLAPMTMINEVKKRPQLGKEKIPKVVEGIKVAQENKKETTMQRDDDVLTWERNRVKIYTLTEWENVNTRVTELVIPSKYCNESKLSVFDVSGLKGLKQIEIGDECFENVDEVKVIGLHALERVAIGENSFTKQRNGNNPTRHFYLKGCEKLKELKIGCYSFSDFSVCEISNLASLEVIKIGELNEWSDNFYYASLILESGSDGMK